MNAYLGTTSLQKQIYVYGVKSCGNVASRINQKRDKNYCKTLFENDSQTPSSIQLALALRQGLSNL